MMKMMKSDRNQKVKSENLPLPCLLQQFCIPLTVVLQILNQSSTGGYQKRPLISHEDHAHPSASAYQSHFQLYQISQSSEDFLMFYHVIYICQAMPNTTRQSQRDCTPADSASAFNSSDKAECSCKVMAEVAEPLRRCPVPLCFRKGGCSGT